MSRNRRSGGGARGRKQTQSNFRSNNTDDDGWNVKATRQQKRNKIKNAKSGNRANGASQQKAKRNRRRNKSNANSKPNLNSIVAAIARDSAIGKWERDEIVHVAKEMDLKAYNPKDTEMKYQIIDALQKHAQMQLTSAIEEDHQMTTSPVAPSQSHHQMNGKAPSKTVAAFKGNKDRIQHLEDKEEEESEYEDDVDDDDDDEEDEEEEESESESESEEEEEEEEGSSYESVTASEDESASVTDDDDDEEEEDDDDDDDDDEDEDDDDEEEEEEDDEEEDDNSLDDDDHEEEEVTPHRVEEKERSPTPTPPSEPSVEPQPQRNKRKKRRRRKNKKQTGSTQEAVTTNHVEPEQRKNGKSKATAKGKAKADPVESTTVSTSTTASPEKGRKRKKKSSLSDTLRGLDLTQSTTSSLMEGWITMLNKSNNVNFLQSFRKARGIEHVVRKVVLQSCNLDLKTPNDAHKRVRDCILRLFDIMLSGTNSYHQWLLDELINLSRQIMKQTTTNTGSNLVSIISEQAEAFVRAQCSVASKNKNQIVVERDQFDKPSQLLHDGHRPSDPMIPVLKKLDGELARLSDLYHTLKEHDYRIRLECPTQSEAFRIEYEQIRGTLTNNISLNSNMQRTKESELESMQHEKTELDREQKRQLRPREQDLQSQEREKYRLQLEKEGLEEQLRRNQEQLNTIEDGIEDTKRALQEMNDEFKPKIKKLEDSMCDHQFEIAAFAREADCYSALERTVGESFRRLDNWSRVQLDSNNSDRSGKEDVYIEHFERYIDEMCAAKLQVMARLRDIKQTKEIFHERCQQTHTHYRQSFNIQTDIKQCEQWIESDEEMNKNMEQAIINSIEKARAMVSRRLFDQFIERVSCSRAAECINLARYKTQRQVNKVPVRMQRSTVSTQTNIPRAPLQRRAQPRPRIHGQHTVNVNQQMGQPMQQRVQDQNQHQGVGMSQQHQGQHQGQQPPRPQQQHTAPHRRPRNPQRQPLPSQRVPQRAPISQQTMNGTVNHQNRQSVNVHMAPSQMAMGGRKPPMIKNNQNEQSQQMMRNMVNVPVNGTPHRRGTGAIKPPVVSNRHNAHFNQPPQSQNVQNGQQAQGQQQSPQQQQGQRVRRAPMPNNQGNQMNIPQTSYRQQF